MSQDVNVNFVNKYTKKQADLIGELINARIQMEVQIELMAEQLKAQEEEITKLRQPVTEVVQPEFTMETVKAGKKVLGK